MISRMYILKARGSGKILSIAEKLVTFILTISEAESERRVIMFNGKKVIVVGFIVSDVAKEYVRYIKKQVVAAGIGVTWTNDNALWFDTPNVSVRVVLKEDIGKVTIDGADYIIGGSWLHNAPLGFKSPGCKYAHGYSGPWLIDLIKSIEVAVDHLICSSFLTKHLHIPQCAGASEPGGCRRCNPEIKKVHFSGPVTCVIWTDGTKTLVRCKDGETLDPEKGLAMAIAKKLLGTNKTCSNYYDAFRKWLPKEEAAPETKDKVQDIFTTVKRMIGESFFLPKGMQDDSRAED